jgi:hypothetical protein
LKSPIMMTKLRRGNLPRACDAEEGAGSMCLCLSLVMLQLRAITLCSIAVLAISDDENSIRGHWAITLLHSHRMARASMQ